MTYHRWRHAERDARATPAEPAGSLSAVARDRLAERQVENERLKKLVISLLLEILEKTKLVLEKTKLEASVHRATSGVC
jgi:hypothetical protein